jgi:hypothetical protein
MMMMMMMMDSWWCRDDERIDRARAFEPQKY